MHPNRTEQGVMPALDDDGRPVDEKHGQNSD